MLSKFELKEKLENGVTTVVFEKMDGTERTMQCTLLAEYLPEIKNQRTETENLINVWDVEQQGWRSFRVNSVKQVL